MQVIYGAGLASNISITAQKRLVRPAYSNTLAHPYAALIDPSFRNSDGTVRTPKNGDTQGATPTGAAAAAPLTRTADAFTLDNSVVPGSVMVKTSAGEYAALASGQNAAEQPFGLLAQWIGGTFDNLGQNNQVGVWQGVDSVYELLAPAWDDTGLASAITASAGSGTISDVKLYAGVDGRLKYLSSPGNRLAVARVMDRPSASRLVVQLLV